MPTVTVWRVENPKTHRGPYNDTDMDDKKYDVRSQVSNAHSTWFSGNLDTHPAWTQDGLSHVASSAWVACCDSFDSLINWFDTWIDKLLEVGYQIVSYEVDSSQVIHGHSGLQCAALLLSGVRTVIVED